MKQPGADISVLVIIVEHFEEPMAYSGDELSEHTEVLRAYK